MTTSKPVAGVDYPGLTIVYCCHDGKGNIFMAKRNANCRDEHGRWDIGGGRIEHGDTVHDTIARELAEEYDATPEAIEFLGYRDVHREHDGHATHWIALDFKVLVKNARNNEPHKFDDAQWFPLNKLPTPVHSQLPHFLEKYKTSLR